MTRNRQRGAFMMARALLVVGILVAMLVIPVYLKKERENREAEVYRKELEMSRGPAAAPASAASPGPSDAPRPIGHGLSFALMADLPPVAPELVRLGCQGEPAPQDQARQGACNPMQGDTSCRTVLPVLCVRPSAAPAPAGFDPARGVWVGGALGGTQPVMGAVVESEAMGSARCEKELGPGWQMAGLSVGGSGAWALQGQRGPGLTAHTRYWVHAADQKANCWDSGG